MVGDWLTEGNGEAGRGKGLRRAALTLAVAMVACGKPAATPEPPAPAGPGYVFYYQGVGGVHRLDARSGADRLLFSIAPSPVASAASPDRSRLAIGYRGADSSRVVVVDVATGAVRRLHAAGRTYRYTLAWSRDGARLAVGYFTERRVGRETLPGAGDIVIASLDGGLTRVGCEASKMVYAWVAADTIVVGDGRELNPVDIRGCRSNASMRLQGKREITFSPDGKRLFYFATGQARRGRRAVASTELYVARYDGTGARRVVGDPYDPQHAQWSPDGSRIAFDVRPPDGPSLRYIAVYDLGQERLRFFPSQTADGTAFDSDPFWAPSGEAQLVHDRILGASARKILRTLALDPSAVQVEPGVLVSGSTLGGTWGWADESHLLVVSDQWVKLVSTSGGLVYQMPGGRTILHAASLVAR